MHKVRIDLLKNELDLLKRKWSTGRDMEVVRREVADARDDMKELGFGLRRDSSGS